MRTPESPPRQNNRTWRLLAGLAVTGLGLYLAIQFCKPLWALLSPYYEFVSDKEQIKAVIKGAGPLAPLLFIGLQALQVIFAPIPGEATGFLGGYLFGVPLGLLYSTLGLTLGSAGAFLLGHWLEKRYVTRIVSRETMKRFDFLMEHQGALVAFILFLIPGFPKDYLCFILGLSPMDFRVFLVICTIGRLPGTLILTLQGAEIYAGHYWSTLILFGVSLLMAGLAYYFRDKLYVWIRRLEIYHRNNRMNKLNNLEESQK
uniref:TVP38/TMEM64 family membrane protein n=1 Tax=Desulfobacca acetoxidans TaxID=60893 RepID=A0A7C3UZP0_9BACT